MKTRAICLTTMEKKHAELIEVFPRDSLTEEQKEFVRKSSLPIGATKGNYFAIKMDNFGEILFSYIFVIPTMSENKRDIIASLTSIAREHEKILADKIHEESNIQKEFVRTSFAFIIEKLTELGILSLPIIVQIIPAIFDGLSSGHFTIKIDGKKILDFGFGKKNIQDEDELMRETMNKELF